MPRARRAAAPRPRCIPLPADAPALLRAMDSCRDLVQALVPAKCVTRLLRVSKTTRAVLENAHPRRLCRFVAPVHLPARLYTRVQTPVHARTDIRRHEQTSETASPKCIARGLKNLYRFGSITEVYFGRGYKSVWISPGLRTALVQCNGLLSLCLSYVKMRRDGAGLLADVVRACSQLRHLDISGSLLGDDHMKRLAPALGKHTTLDSLDLTFCALGKENSCALAGGFPSSLTRLKLNHNHVRYCTQTLAAAACNLTNESNDHPSWTVTMPRWWHKGCASARCCARCT